MNNKIPHTALTTQVATNYTPPNPPIPATGTQNRTTLPPSNAGPTKRIADRKADFSSSDEWTFAGYQDTWSCSSDSHEGKANNQPGCTVIYTSDDQKQYNENQANSSSEEWGVESWHNKPETPPKNPGITFNEYLNSLRTNRLTTSQTPPPALTPNKADQANSSSEEWGVESWHNKPDTPPKNPGITANEYFNSLRTNRPTTSQTPPPALTPNNENQANSSSEEWGVESWYNKPDTPPKNPGITANEYFQSLRNQAAHHKPTPNKADQANSSPEEWTSSSDEW